MSSYKTLLYACAIAALLGPVLAACGGAHSNENAAHANSNTNANANADTNRGASNNSHRPVNSNVTGGARNMP